MCVRKYFSRIIAFVLLAAVLIIPAQSANSQSASEDITKTKSIIRIGILAYQGYKNVIIRWQPTATLLSENIRQFSFELVPLSLQEMDRHVKNHLLDFVITNPGNYIHLSHTYGISRIATLVNKKNNLVASKFGAVIFTKSNRDDIKSLQDIRGKTLSAVNKNGFGGFYMAQLAFKKQDIAIFEDAKEVIFTGFPQIQVLKLVLSGKSDIGTFRTDSLEQLVKYQNFDLSKIKILNQQNTKGFPFLLSTALYPEWPMAKLPNTSKEVAHLVALALLSMPENSDAAIAAQSAGWTIPLNYKPVYDLLKTLKASPFDIEKKLSLRDVFEEYFKSIFVIILGILLIATSLFWITKLNQKIRNSNKQLKSEIRKRTRLTNKLEYLATHDELTGILNRRAFTAELQEELDRSARYNHTFSLMLLDIDKFKSVNDNFGHQTGDKLLVEISQRISILLRSNDLFFRIGGDEFAIINIDVDSKHEIETLCDRIYHTLNKPHHIGNDRILSSMSIGYAIYPIQGKNIEDLNRSADIDMFNNKRTKSMLVGIDSQKNIDASPA